MNFAEKAERAIHQNDIEFVRTALKKGIDVNTIYTIGDSYYDNFNGDYDAYSFEYQTTLLSMAISSQKLEIVQLLLKAGADPNIEVDGITPLRHAVNWNYMDIAEVLVKAGAKFEDIMTWNDYHYIEKFMFIAAKQRIRLFKEELMKTTWHPKRMDKWLEAGVLDMMIG